MDVTIRPARPGDLDSIAPWTTDTFSWGDYIPDRFTTWLEEDGGEVLVTVDGNDVPTALCHVTMLSPTEAWLEGARVHPDHRRTGLGSALNHAGVEWARERGARVIRLSVDTDNAAAREQVKRLGYREVSSWLHATFEIDATHRTTDRYRMRPAPGADAEAAWLFWASSDLARESRELIHLGWQWRTARPGDITGVAGQLVQSAAGWACVEQPEDDWMRTNWIASTSEDMLGLIDGLLELAAARGANELDIKLPDLPWTAEAIIRSGADPSPIIVHAKPIY